MGRPPLSASRTTSPSSGVALVDLVDLSRVLPHSHCYIRTARGYPYSDCGVAVYPRIGATPTGYRAVPPPPLP